MHARRCAAALTAALLATVTLTACETVPRAPAPDASSTAERTATPSPAGGSSSTPATTASPTASTAPTGADSTSGPATLSSLVASGDRAVTALATLTVKGKSAMTGYDREQYGAAWADVDHNGCDTRNDVLDRDLTDKTYREGTHSCIVTTGTIVSPYTGSTISFERGNVTSLEVQIDHVVALANSWVTGAQRWDTETRKAFANDPLNLLAVDGASNSKKLASDASAWLPKSKAFRCTYVALQISVKAKYGLAVTKAEKTAMRSVLDACPAQTTYTSHPVPAKTTAGRTGSSASSSKTSSSATNKGATSSKAKTSPKAGAKAGSKPAAATDPQFGTCGEAVKNGYGPYVDGEDPEYDWYRDGDGDGVVCE